MVGSDLQGKPDLDSSNGKLLFFRLKEARVAFEAALSYLRVAKLEENVKKKFIKDVNASLQKVDKLALE